MAVQSANLSAILSNSARGQEAQTMDAPNSPVKRRRPTLYPPDGADGPAGGVVEVRPGAGDPDVGDRLGPYFLQRLAGSGGMGRVFRAIHERLGRTVAIKIMYRSCAIGDGPRRFLREARAVNKIHRKRPHPDVIEITDIHEAPEGEPSYYVMEWLEGYSLQERRVQCNGFVPIPELLRVMIAVADAVEAAHQVGLIHRDLKPENIFLAETIPGGGGAGAGAGPYQVKLLDFGVARDMAEPDSAQPDRLMGTPPYIAPEQVIGDSAGDPRTDIYAMGVILYELTVGSLPFEGPDLEETLMRRVDKPAPEPRRAASPEARARIPSELEQIILCCLQRDPQKRYPTMVALRDDLRALERHLAAPLWRRLLHPQLLRSGIHQAGLKTAAKAAARPRSPRARRRRIARLVTLSVLLAASAGVWTQRERVRKEIEGMPELWMIMRPLLNPESPEVPQSGPMPLEVQIRSTPSGAEVLYGGVRVGTTPCVVRLPEGQRTLEFRRAGHRRVIREVDVRIGAQVFVKLEPSRVRE